MGVNTQHGNDTETFMRTQIGRLKGFPRWEGFRDELVKVLWREAYSNDHAERIIDSVIETRRPNEEGFVSCPTVAELMDYCRAVPAERPLERKPADGRCPLCHGIGFVHTQRKVRALPGLPERLYDYSAPCPCRAASAGAA